MNKLAALLLLTGSALVGPAFTGCDVGASACELAQTEAESCGLGSGECDEGDGDQACVARCINLVAESETDDEGTKQCPDLVATLDRIKVVDPDVNPDRNDIGLIFEDLGRLKQVFERETPLGVGGAGADADADAPISDPAPNISDDFEICIANCWI